MIPRFRICDNAVSTSQGRLEAASVSSVETGSGMTWTGAKRNRTLIMVQL